MKKLILSELLILFLATTFISDNQPGWYQLPINIGNRQITDIYFLDSLTGWVVTNGGSSGTDSALCLKTTNGGTNWTEQIKTYGLFNAVQFIDINTGYIAADRGPGFMLKSTNSGINWFQVFNGGDGLTDLSFINKDTGWACDPSPPPFGVGIIKTTTGGANWFQQLGAGFRPQKLFFINNDTGWVGSADWKLYRTTNSGQVWELQYTTSIAVNSIFFLDVLRGWIRAGTGNGVAYTTNGGFNWTPAQGEPAGSDLRFVNDSVGYSGGLDNRIRKSVNGGKNWGYQNSPIYNNLSVSMLRNDTIHGWAGGNGLVYTTDGGGPITFTGVQQISNEIPSDIKLYQNYPNPFNPSTIIRFQIQRLADLKLVLYDITGKEITLLVSGEYRAGIYEIDFSGVTYSSGVYFYSMFTDGKLIGTKKMILIR